MHRVLSVLCVAGALAAGAAGPASAAADDPPPFTGLLDFSAIGGSADPEQFSWRVSLGPDQELGQVDDQEAVVFYSDDMHPAFSIKAEQARDADGDEVPTSLAVTGGDELTLTVHHRAGDPAAGGAPFDYPITPGAPFETGYSTVLVTGPPDETQLREERERVTRNARAAQEAREVDERAALEASRCHVPALRAESLRAAKRLLRSANCGVGEVTKRRGATARGGRVVAQRPRVGAVLAPGAEVDVTLGVRRDA
jgi:PASTA domain